MDPKANMREQIEVSREIIRVWDNCADDGTLTALQSSLVTHDANRLAELVLALHEWNRKSAS